MFSKDLSNQEAINELRSSSKLREKLIQKIYCANLVTPKIGCMTLKK